MVTKKKALAQRSLGKKAGISKKVLSVVLALSLVVMFPMAKFSLADPALSPGQDAVEYGDDTSGSQADETGGGSATDPDETGDDLSNGDNAGLDDQATQDEDATGLLGEVAAAFEGVGITPLGGPIGGGVYEADSWADLKAAMSNSTITEIRFTTDITRSADASAGNDLPQLSRSLIIDGRGYTLDFRAGGTTTQIDRSGIELSNTAAMGSQLTLKNINIVRPNGGDSQTISVSGLSSTLTVHKSRATTNGQSWTVNLNNIKSPTVAGTAPSGGLVNIPRGIVYVTGELVWDTTITGVRDVANAQTIINARQQYYSAANVSLKGASRTIQASAPGETNVISVKDGTKMKVECLNTGDTQAVYLGFYAPSTIANFIADGANTEVTLTGNGNSNDGGYESGTFVVNCSGNASITITGGAKVNVKSTLAPSGSLTQGNAAISFQATHTGRIDISGEGSELNAEAWGESFTGDLVSGGYGAAVYVRNAIEHQYFTVTDKAKLNIIQHYNTGSKSHCALSLSNDFNTFNVESGASVIITNEGSSASVNSGANLYCNAAIEFYWGYSEFNISGYQSNVSLYSTRGVAFNAVSTTATKDPRVKVNCNEGAIFIARGNIDSASITGAPGAINVGSELYPRSSFEFNCDKPLYYDFANTSDKARAKLFTAQASTNSFSSKFSDVAIWGNGAFSDKPNVAWDGPYFRSWTLPTYTLTGTNFRNLSCLDDLTLNTDGPSFGPNGMSALRRIQGNNAGPIINELMQPTNADKYVRAIGTVPEGLDFIGRPWWDNEVFGRLQITHPGGAQETSQAGQFLSLNTENIYIVEPAGTLEGVLRYAPPSGNFLTVGDKYKIISAWRGDTDDPNNAKQHFALTGGIPDYEVTVKDVLPPVPAVITSPNNGKIWVGATPTITGTWLPAAQQAAREPHNPDPAVKLYAVANNSANKLKDGSGNEIVGTLNANGTWSFPLGNVAPSYLTEGTRIYFILEDAVGNVNPLVKTAIHDTTMEPAPYLVVSQPDLLLEHDDKVIGLREARTIANQGQNTPAQFERLKTTINARATVLTGGMSDQVEVTLCDPSWDLLSYFDVENFVADNPGGSKVYTVKYQSVADPSLSRTGTITVLPYETPYIDAHSFTISQANAVTMMAKNTADRDAEIIFRADAKGRLDLNQPMLPENVEIATMNIPNDGTPGVYDVAFAVKGIPHDLDHIIAIKVTIVLGNYPVLNVTSPIGIWIGDPAEPFISAGGERPDRSIMPSEFDIMAGVQAWDEIGGADITSQVTHVGTVDMNKKGYYPITYSVKNTQGNTTTATRLVFCTDGTIVYDDNYILEASSFIKKQSEANAGTILADGQVYAYLVDTSNLNGKVDTDAAVVSPGGYGAGCALGTYDITLRVVPRAGQPASTLQGGIQATVVNKDKLTDDKDPATYTRYTIGANNVSIRISEAAGYAGITDDVKLKLINASKAEAWRLTSKSNHLGADFDVTSMADSGVDVVSNDIPASGGVVGQAYNVTFSIKSVPSITVTVTYTLAGSAPVITFVIPEGYPLVVPFERTDPKNLTPEQIKDKMSVMDPTYNDLKDITTYTVNGVPNGTINTGNVGVYQVTYSVTNQDNMSATATRAIVVDDGRYVIDRDNEVIIGAKNFVARSSAVDGTLAQVQDWSRAYAYDIIGNQKSSVEFGITPFPPVGSGYVANAPKGTYYFTWKVVGKPTIKEIKGYITDADVIYPGDDNDQYAMIAYNFKVNTTRAGEMIASGLDAALIAESKVEVIKLVDSVDTAVPYVVANGGFSTTQAVYDLTFGATIGANPVITSPNPTQVKPKGTVSNGNAPEITCPTPLEVWIGDTAMPITAITPTQYAAVPNNMYGVTADDYEDGDLTDKVVVTPLLPATGVDLDTPGLYTFRYTVTDSDFLTDTKLRVVVVNDGSYTVGQGRILYAKSFVTRLSEVTTNPTLIQAEVLSKSRAKLYDGTTGNEITLDSGSISSVNTGSYGPTKGIYPITINAIDTPTGVVSRTINGVVVDAKVIGPTIPPVFGTTTYVYGTPIEHQTNVQAEALAAAGEAAILEALEAKATKFLATGTLVTPSPAVKIVEDMDGYISTFASGGSTTDDWGIYRFKVSDVEDATVIELYINVGKEGPLPTLVANPKPLEYKLPLPASLKNGSNLSDDAVKQGVVATDPDLTPPAVPYSQISTVIYDVSDGVTAVPVTAIPADKAGIFRVTYSYTDAYRYTVSDTRAVVVNDGRYKIDDHYILQSLNFVIKSSDVQPTNATAQIILNSEALAWDVEGVSTPVNISSIGAYSKDPGDKSLTVEVLGYPALSKSIRAKVLNDTNTATPNANQNGANGISNSIVANNFRINAIDANSWVLLAGTTDYANKFFAAANVSIFDRTADGFGLSTLVTRQMVSDGGFATKGSPLEQGDSFTVTFACAEDTQATTTITVFIDNGLPPVITAPYRIIWSGDAAEPFKSAGGHRPDGSILPSDWVAQNGMQGVLAMDDYDGNITSDVEVGSVDGAGVFTKQMPVTDTTPVDLALEDEDQYISYQVTDSDHNTTTETFAVMVTKNAEIIGDYLVLGYSFVETVDNVIANGTDGDTILRLADAHASRIEGNIRIPTDFVMSISDDAGYKAEVGTYTPIKIWITAEPGYKGSAEKNDETYDITGKVVDKDVIGGGQDTGHPNNGFRYFVGANHALLTLSEADGFKGLEQAAIDKLIARAKAEAWETTHYTIADHDVDVISNQIGDPGHPIKAGGTYEVTFVPKGVTGVVATVIFTIDNGNYPVITFDEDSAPGVHDGGYPLVIKQQKGAAAHNLTDAEIKAKMTVMDEEDGNLWDDTTFVIDNTAGKTINTSVVQVYSVTYSVTDSDGNTTTATRAIVIDDGRYVIDKPNGVIIGAKNFVLAKKDVDGSFPQVRSASKAWAYTIQGAPILASELEINPFPPANYKAQPDVGVYFFNWMVKGKPTMKTIKGYVTDADVIYPGEDDDQYAMTAMHFTVNLIQAQDMINAGLDDSLITKADVRVIKLVDSADDATPYVIENGGFKAELNTDPGYVLDFGAKVGIVTVPDVHVTPVYGKVSQGDLPVLTVPTPINVWIGDPAEPFEAAGGERPDNSILLDEYTAGGGDLYGVTATDTEDDAAGIPLVIEVEYLIPATGVDLTEPEIYTLRYSVTDSDNNTVTALRVVAINDGSIKVGKGRILMARSFVTRLATVTDDPDLIQAEILDKGRVKLYDGTDGTEISLKGNIDDALFDDGDYQKKVGTYPITIAVNDTPDGTILRNITGKVVDAHVIGPVDPPKHGNIIYVYGNNIFQTISEAEATAAGGDVAIIAALKAEAVKITPTEVMSPLDVTIVDRDDYIGRLTDSDDTNDVGIYRFTVTDVEGVTSIQLTITVSTGGMPVVTANPKPLNIPMPVAAGSVDGSGNLTREKLMEGVVATDAESVTPTNPTGDVRDGVVITIVDVNGDTPTTISAIPAGVAGVYQVTYTYTDEDHNVASDSRAVIVNDGSFIYDGDFILKALSFVIKVSDVEPSGATAQLLSMSEAKAWTTEGVPSAASISAPGGYMKSVGAYIVTIQPLGHPALQKDITARVLNNSATTEPNKNQNGGNGVHYSILAANFRINVNDANALVAKAGTPAYADDFFARAGITADGVTIHDRTSSALSVAPTMTRQLVNDGGFATSGALVEGDKFYITFACAEDPAATTTIIAFVHNGGMPWIKAPGLKTVALDDPFTEDDYMEGVTYGDAEDPVSDLKVTHDTPVNTAVEDIYRVTYTVEDTEGNTGSCIGFVLVGPWDPPENNYAVSAWNFVTTVKAVQAAVSIDNLILSRSHAKAVHIITDSEGNVIDLEDVTPVIKNSDGFAAVVNDYSPVIGVAPEDKPAKVIAAKVIDRDRISNEPDPTGDIHDTNTADPTDTSRYIVAANDVALTWAQAGQLAGKLDNVTKSTLIDMAEAVGYKITNVGSNSVTTNHNVDVIVNNIAQASGSYDVTFIPLNVGGVSVTVKFNVTGSAASLVVDGPLEFDATDDSAILTRNQLLEGVTVYDAKTPPLTLADVVITDASGTMPSIDTAEVGVYTVTYTLTDPQVLVDDGTGNMVPTVITVDRAVIINDGRFVVDEPNEVIVGAKDFVVSTKDTTFTGTVADALRLSFAEAYDFEGKPLAVELASTLPAGFAARDLGVYDFTFRPVGYPDTLKSIKGEVVDADVVDLGPDPYRSKYALLAYYFTVDVSQAALITTDAGLIAAAKVRVVKLVPRAADASPVVFDNGGFTDRKGMYDIVFGISGIAQSVRSATIVGTVTDSSAPTLSVKTPYEIPVGSTWDRPLAMVSVSAFDPGDGDITDKVVYYPTVAGKDVNTAVPGLYLVTYQVEDSDNNVVTAPRVVVVNDGRYVVGEGRILEAYSFVIKLADVESNAAQLRAQLLAMTGAKLYDGTTGDELPASLLSIQSMGGYSRTVGEYPVVVAAPDTPTGTLTKNVQAKVVDADVIDDEPLDPDDPSGSKVFVYGNNITLRVSQAAAITTPAALLTALSAHATIVDVTNLTGAFTPQAVMVVDNGGFSATPGLYTVKVADIDGICEIALTVNVIVGEAPVITPQRPVIVPISSAGGTLSDAQKKGTTTAFDKEDGDLTSKIVVTGSVPANVAGVYPITYSVTDSDGNKATARTVVVVDDGNFVFGDDYVLYAKNFTLDRSAVDNSAKSAQILNLSGAYAVSYEGDPATAYVVDIAGYQDVAGQYHPRIGVAQETALTKQITATVTAPAARYRVTFNANGGWLTGPSAIYVQAPATTLAYLPSSPLRTGYNFTYWATTAGGGTQFTADTPVTANRTVYAQWEKIADPKQPDIIVNNYTTVNPPAVYVTGAPDVYITNPTTTTYVEVPVKDETAEETKPVEDKVLGETPTPITSPITTWSLFDVCAVVLALLLLLAFGVKFFIDRKKRDDEFAEEPIDAAVLSNMAPERRMALLARREEDRRAFMEEQRVKEEKQKTMYVNAPVLLIVAAAFVEALIILLTTQDFGGTRVITDAYSIPLSLIVLLQLITPMVAALLKNRSERNKGDSSPSQDAPTV